MKKKPGKVTSFFRVKTCYLAQEVAEKKKISGRTVLSQLVSLQKMLDLLKKLRYTNGDKKLVIQLQGLRDGGVRGRSLLWISQQ